MGDVSQLDKIIYSEENHLTHTIYFLVLRWLKKYNLKHLREAIFVF